MPRAIPKALAPEALAELLRERHSVRGFLPEALPRETIDSMVAMAQMAPSWCNIQPWRVAITEPPLTRKLSDALVAAAKVQLPNPEIPFPLVYPEPYDAHRRKCGGELYGAMGIAREDKGKRYDAWLRNYEFFGAPHLLVVSRDQRLGEYATLDVGVWLGTLLVAAQSHGIDTCPMASVAAYPEVLRERLEIPDNEVILFGVAIGMADPSVPANAARTTREPLAANLRYLGPTSD
jgi:nitroreductase